MLPHIPCKYLLFSVIFRIFIGLTISLCYDMHDHPVPIFMISFPNISVKG